MIMRDTMIQRMTMAVAVVCGLLSGAFARADATRQEWRFDGGANPVAPEVCNPPGVTSQATITPGEFSGGWQSQLPGLGTATGFWDLGSRGRIVLPVSTGAQAGAKTIRVRVSQWADGGIFSTRATVSVAGATFTGDHRTITENGSLGNWETDESEWALSEGQTAGDLTIISALNGSLVDSVAVIAEASGSSVVLNIQRSTLGSNRVDLSWPASATGYALESTTNLTGPIDWQPVPGTPLTVGDRLVFTVEVNVTAKFFRLRKP
jgi:hypothetical protein